ARRTPRSPSTSRRWSSSATPPPFRRPPATRSPRSSSGTCAAATATAANELELDTQQGVDRGPDQYGCVGVVTVVSGPGIDGCQRGPGVQVVDEGGSHRLDQGGAGRAGWPASPPPPGPQPLGARAQVVVGPRPPGAVVVAEQCQPDRHRV